MDVQEPPKRAIDNDQTGLLAHLVGGYLLVGVWVFAVALAFGALYLTTQSKTPTESALSAILLTCMSVLVSWVVAHHYALAARRKEISEINEAHEKSLKMYALKAAEKVMNLSRELDRLSGYLVAYRDAEEDESRALVLRTKDERITGAIHIVAMLRSVNDTALSDWEGVIGEELDEKREEEKEEREEYLDDLILKVDQVVESVKALEQTNPMTAETIRKEFGEVRNELIAALLGGSVGASATVSGPKRIGKYAQLPCPKCNGAFRIRLSASGRVRFRGYHCPICKASLVAEEDSSGEPILSLRLKLRERVACPDCGVENAIELDTLRGVAANFACAKCAKQLYAYRGSEGVNVRLLGSTKQSSIVSSTMTPDFVTSVRAELPAQPWPTGVHRHVAERLGVSPSRVQKAIKVLILNGVFKHQIDGKVVE